MVVAKWIRGRLIGHVVDRLLCRNPIFFCTLVHRGTIRDTLELFLQAPLTSKRHVGALDRFCVRFVLKLGIYSDGSFSAAMRCSLLLAAVLLRLPWISTGHTLPLTHKFRLAADWILRCFIVIFAGLFLHEILRLVVANSLVHDTWSWCSPDKLTTICNRLICAFMVFRVLLFLLFLAYFPRPVRATMRIV